MKIHVWIFLLLTNTAFAIPANFPGTPTENDPNFILNEDPPHWPPQNPNPDQDTNPEVATEPMPPPSE